MLYSLSVSENAEYFDIMEPDSITIAVIYHYPCYDGLFSCLPLYLYYRCIPSATIHYYPYRTNQPFTQSLIPASLVYFLDCIGTKEMLETLLETAREIVILDHHHQVRDIVDSWGVANDSPYLAQKVNFAHIRTDICAAKIAWEYFNRLNNGSLVPRKDEENALLRVFDYVEDRDMYRNALPDTRKVSCGLRDL
jgi:hypothetical protein